MIRVKIVQGEAIDVEELKIRHDFFKSFHRIVSYWHNLFIDRFQVVAVDPDIAYPKEGLEYWAWPCGNGKIYLIEQIGDENMIA